MADDAPLLIFVLRKVNLDNQKRVESMKKIYVSVCFVSALMGFASCASTRDMATVADMAGEWNIIEINGAAVVPAPGQEFPFIGFDAQGGKVYGNSGCNRIMGSFDVNAKPGSIDLGALGSTRMMCPDMTVEKNVLSALAQVKAYKRIGKDQMALCGSSKRSVVVLKKKDNTMSLAMLEGRWNIVEAAGEAVPQNMENQPFLELDIAGKKLHGNAGCNVINGGFQTEEGNVASISFPNLISTMMACPNMDVEGRVTKALGAVKTFGKLASGDMGLYDADGTLVMVLKKM